MRPEEAKGNSAVGVSLRALREIARQQPFLLPFVVLDSALSSLFPFVAIYLSGEVLDAVERHEPLEQILQFIGFTAILNFLVWCIQSGVKHMKNVQVDRLEHYREFALSRKLMEMPYAWVENAETHIRLEKVQEIKRQGGDAFCKLVQLLNPLLNGVFTLVTSLILFFVIIWPQGSSAFISGIETSVVFVIMLLLLSVTVVVTNRLNRRNAKAIQKTFNILAPINRIFGFYRSQIFNDYHYGKDIRIYAQKPLLEQEFKGCLTSIKSFMEKRGSDNGRFQLLSGALLSLMGGAVYLFVGAEGWKNTVSTGNVVQLIGGILQFVNGVMQIISSIEAILLNGSYLRITYEFLDDSWETPRAVYHRPLPALHTIKGFIEFRKVSFHYPCNEAEILRDIDLRIEPGERLAIVGLNGSGKTTLIKLLCGLYPPSSGQILLDGIDVTNYPPLEYQRLFSAVFQDFKIFSFSAAFNVAASMEMNPDRIWAALRLSGCAQHFEEAPKGIDTCINKDFDEEGVDISGGEAQKLAIAKAVYKDAPIVILDEPTAALDPRAELEIYTHFDQLIGEKTAVYISHRLSSCQFCDRILVMHEGRIIETGSHQKLLQEKGEYASMWRLQSEQYGNACCCGE